MLLGRPDYILIVVITCCHLIGVLTKERPPMCIESGCKRVRFSNHTYEAPSTVNKSEEWLIVVGLPAQQMKIKALTLARKYKYCEWVPLMDNHDCGDEHEENIKVDEAEIEKAFKDSKCLVGAECTKGGDCWGNGAGFCKDSARKMAVSPKDYGPIPTWTMTLYHTCLQTWKCKIKELSTPIIMISEGVRGVDILGKKVPISPTKNKVVQVDDTSYLVYGLPANKYSVKATCYKTPLLKTCHIKGEIAGEFGITISFKKGECHSQRGELIFASSCESPDISDSLSAKDSYASLDDVRKISEEIIFENAQSTYEAQLLSKEFSKAMINLEKLSQSLFRLVPALYGMYSGSKGIFIDMNNDEFLYCPCLTKPKKASTCYDKFIYKRGLLYQKEIDDKCYDLAPGKTEELNPILSQLVPIDSEFLTEPLFLGKGDIDMDTLHELISDKEHSEAGSTGEGGNHYSLFYSMWDDWLTVLHQYSLLVVYVDFILTLYILSALIGRRV